ncbi:MAG TPA: MDR family oxidoreductase [Bauldia sp.]|nr:MDR family oxidoreductase [Bauldia sp.]
MDKFRALLVTRDEATKVQSVGLREISAADLMDGDVDVRVEYSTVNYKDGLAITGKLPVVRRFPMVPGIDLAGTVTASRNPAFRPGDKVLLNGWGVGETHLGAYAEMARLKGDWLIPLPKGLTAAETMAVGTAGYTAMLAIMMLERHWYRPVSGRYVVTGAAGGVGSMAIAFLAAQGIEVDAVTGRPEEADYLRSLGASGIIPRSELEGEVPQLGKERWAAGIDAVGHRILANILAVTKADGAVASVGRAAGPDLPAMMAPFILRGVALLGINSVYMPKALRIAAWERIAAVLDRRKLAAMTTTIQLDQLPDAARQILEGKVRGRVVVEIARS